MHDTTNTTQHIYVSINFNQGITMSNQLVQIDDLKSSIVSIEDSFTQLASIHKEVNFLAECNFALQHLTGNKSLIYASRNNPESLKFAITNVASIGISLCPAKKEAYLIARKGVVTLDISYMGLCHLAQKTGAIMWAQAVIVHKNDDYKVGQTGERPHHEYEPFGSRGEIIGVYSVAKTCDGAYLITNMPIEEVFGIRERSEGYKAYMNKKIKSCPWITDESEMIKKTVLKRAFKTWPKSASSKRVAEAIEVLNMNDPIDFSEDKMITDDQKTRLKELLRSLNKEAQPFLDYLETKYRRSEITIDDITESEADKEIIALNDMVERLKKNEEKESEVIEVVAEVVPDDGEIVVEF